MRPFRSKLPAQPFGEAVQSRLHGAVGRRSVQCPAGAQSTLGHWNPLSTVVAPSDCSAFRYGGGEEVGMNAKCPCRYPSKPFPLRSDGFALTSSGKRWILWQTGAT